jgi:triacylglycerol lipase
MADIVMAAPRLPIILASGFSPVKLPLKPGIRRLRQRGCDITVVPFRLSDMRNVETFAEHIAEAVKDAIKRSPTGRVNLVGLSMGGVASLHAIKRLGIAPLVDTFIAVGSPFHGSKMSWLALPTGAFTRTGRQLLPGSSYLRKLRSEPLPPNTRYVSIAGTSDTICPPSTALLDGTEQVETAFDHHEIFRNFTVHDLFVAYCH